jgi:predicted  nucleic acid-binding Zn-ribbon protein
MAIFTAIGTAIAGALFAGSALAATVISTGLAFAARIGMQYLNRPKARKYSAVQGETQYGGDISAQTLYGTGKTKGQRVFYAKWGKGNRWNADVFLLANGWCDGLEPYIYVFGEKKALISKPTVGSEVARYFVEDFTANENGYLVIRFYDGRPGQPVDQRLVDVSSDLGQKWKTTSVNAGLCYVIVERSWSEDFFGAKGKPEIEFVLRGLREYDPRKDSTVAGGSGTQRLANPSTWRHTNNPAVHRLNYQLGLRALVSGRTLIGEGKSLGQLDLGTYFLSMNVCDALRTDGKKRYQCSLFVTGDDDHTEVLREFEDAMAGYGLNRRGLSGVIPGAPQIPVLEITVDDIPVDRAKEIQFRKSAFDRFNHLSGQFTSIESMWNPESLKPVYVNADIAEDGRNRQTSNDFLQVSDPDLAQYLLNIRYRQNRKGATATLPVSRAVGFRVQEGEWVEWRGREWMISEWNLDEQFRITLKLAETGADIYDDDDIEAGPVVIPPTPPVNPSMLSTVKNFTVEPWFVENESGYKAPGLRFRWTPPDDPTIIAVRVEYRAEGSQELLKATSNDPEGGELIITTNVVPGQIYEARATIMTVPDRLKTWTPWVTTAQATVDLQIILDYLDVQIREDLAVLNQWIDDDLADQVGENAQALIAEAQARIEALAAEAQARANAIAEQADALTQEQSERVAGALESSQRYRAILDEIGSIRDYASNADYSQYQQKEELRRTLTQRVNEVVAYFDERITVATGDNGGVVERLTTLEVKTDKANAAILLVDTASVDRDNALAVQISSVSAGTDNQFDPVRLWLFDSNVQSWTGNGAPTVSNGYLRPADQATDPYVVSPAALGINANQYRQVRARIRKTGNPTWEGYAWWKASGDTTWDAARRAAVEQPVYDAHGIGLITFDMPWTGSIDQIRIDLSSIQTATDYFEFDWISIGAPSPGASRAELLAEQSARASGDSANAQSITALQALFQDVNGDVTALASGVTTLTTQVSNLADGVSAQGEALTSLTVEIAGKANITALQSLSAEVEALGGGGIVSQGEAITAIRNGLLGIASEVLDQDFANFLGQQAIRGALTEASQSLSTRIEVTNNSLTLVTDAVTRVQAALPGLATAQAVTTLSSRVSSAEASISSSSQAITELENALPGLASGSALQALSNQVSLQGQDISVLSSAIIALDSEIDGKASASAVQSLSNNVNQQGQTISSISDALVSLDNEIDGKASGTALQSLSNQVSQQGQDISVLNSAILSLDSEIDGKASAAALQSLSNSVSQQGQDISNISNSLLSLDNEIDGKASASALQSLTSEVIEQGGQISAQASSLSELGAALNGKASVDYVGYIEGIVGEHGGEIFAQASALQSLTATVGGVSADARLKFDTVVAQDGKATIGLKARYDANGSYRDASLFIEVPADPSQPTQVLINAQRFSLIDGSAKTSPFVFENGVLKLAVADIGTVNGGVFAVGKTRIDANGITVSS